MAPDKYFLQKKVVEKFREENAQKELERVQDMLASWAKNRYKEAIQGSCKLDKKVYETLFEEAQIPTGRIDIPFYTVNRTFSEELDDPRQVGVVLRLLAEFKLERGTKLFDILKQMDIPPKDLGVNIVCFPADREDIDYEEIIKGEQDMFICKYLGENDVQDITVFVRSRIEAPLGTNEGDILNQIADFE